MTDPTPPEDHDPTPDPADAPEGLDPQDLMAAGLPSEPGDSPTDRPEVADVQAQFPDFEVLELLGQGGMGMVFKARQKRLDRLVALKILPPRPGDDAAFEQRFSREARALARLDHPGIVRVHEFGETEGLYFLVMEYVDGANLRELIRDGQMKAEDALRIVPHICDALQYAHDQGVVHRDVKPENILVSKSGRVKIADFGLAKLSSDTPEDFTLTREGQVMGTAHYMAPEQIEHPTEVDHRADVYSLGVVFYEMLTGELPLGRFQPPSQRVEVDVRLDGVVLRALAKQRDLRFQRVDQVRTEVDAITSTDAPTPAAAATAAAAAGDSSASRENRTWTKSATVSGLAVLGVLCNPVAVVAMVVGAWIGGGSTRGMSIAFTVSGLIVLAGFVASIVAAVRIKHSNGRLGGLWLAVLGMILPFVCTPVAVGGSFLVMRAEDAQTAGASGAAPGSDIDVVLDARPGVPGGRVRVESPPLWMHAAQAQVLASDAGGLLRAVAGSMEEPSFSILDARDLVGPAARKELLGLDEKESTRRRSAAQLGLAGLDGSALPVPLTRFRVTHIRFTDMQPSISDANNLMSVGIVGGIAGYTADVTATSDSPDRWVLIFPVERDGFHWRLALGPVTWRRGGE